MRGVGGVGGRGGADQRKGPWVDGVAAISGECGERGSL